MAEIDAALGISPMNAYSVRPHAQTIGSDGRWLFLQTNVVQKNLQRAYGESLVAALCDHRLTSRPLSDATIPGSDGTSRAELIKTIGRLRKETRDEIDRLTRFLDEADNHTELEPDGDDKLKRRTRMGGFLVFPWFAGATCVMIPPRRNSSDNQTNWAGGRGVTTSRRAS